MLGRLQIVIQVGAEAAQVRDRDAFLLLITQTARELTGATYSSLGFVDGDVIEWQMAAGKPLEEVRGYRQPLEQGLCGWVVRHGRPRRADDVTQEQEYLQQYEEMRSELDVPIKVGEKVTGVLNVESPERAAFDDEDEALLQVLACFVALAWD